MSIVWDNYEFDGPWSLNTWNPLYRAGVYAIMCKPDPLTQPDMYQIIYFGQTKNYTKRGFPSKHQSSLCWINQAGNQLNLYVGVYRMPKSTRDQRRLVESELIHIFRPACNLARPLRKRM